MALSLSAIALIARLRPEIWDILNNPFGPYGRAGGAVQVPVSGAFRTGLRAADELVRLTTTAESFGVAFDVDDGDWCGTPPGHRHFGPAGGWPPIKDPGPDTRFVDYHLGLAAGLEAAAFTWEVGKAARGVASVHDTALATAARLGGVGAVQATAVRAAG